MFTHNRLLLSHPYKAEFLYFALHGAYLWFSSKCEEEYYFIREVKIIFTYAMVSPLIVESKMESDGIMFIVTTPMGKCTSHMMMKQRLNMNFVGLKECILL